MSKMSLKRGAFTLRQTRKRLIINILWLPFELLLRSKLYTIIKLIKGTCPFEQVPFYIQSFIYPIICYGFICFFLSRQYSSSHKGV